VHRLSDYERVVGKEVIDKIRKDAQPLQGKQVVHINSTQNGGGVAEILSSLVPLMNDIGIKAGWRVMKGNNDFFSVTKSFHNGLQGEKIILKPNRKRLYEQTNASFASYTHIEAHHCVIVHDPQPLPLIRHKHKTQPWIWRCHIDLSTPNKQLWNYLKPHIKEYDRAIMSKQSFTQKLPMPQEIIMPSIDPLSHKNRPMSEAKIQWQLKKFNIPRDKPIITQVSRFDKWKDPLGVIEAYKLVKKKVNCRLVLIGSMAADDPEGQAIYEQVITIANTDPDIHVINFESDALVNAIQRASAVVIQKSLREGFGLTVAEALWKGTPVVASNVGGISLQLKNGYNGYLVNSPQTCARAVVKLLQNPKLAKRMGQRGQELVRKKFLITRHLHDYVKLLNKTVINYRPN
jgi:trehalose synthase